MKRKNLKKIISIVLLVAIIAVALSMTVSARYNYIDLLGAGLKISASGYMTCLGVADPSFGTYNVVTVVLEKYSSVSGKWEAEGSTWSGSTLGRDTVEVPGAKYVTKGTYRAKVTANIYSTVGGTLLESQSMYSPEGTY